MEHPIIPTYTNSSTKRIYRCCTHTCVSIHTCVALILRTPPYTCSNGNLTVLRGLFYSGDNSRLIVRQFVRKHTGKAQLRNIWYSTLKLIVHFPILRMLMSNSSLEWFPILIRGFLKGHVTHNTKLFSAKEKNTVINHILFSISFYGFYQSLPRKIPNDIILGTISLKFHRLRICM